MKHPGILLAVLLVLTTATANAQLQSIVIPAGTPEDHEIQAIASEADAQKRLAMWQDFVQKFSANPQAVAYGNQQLSQLYGASGDGAKALGFAEKALAVQPNNLDLLVSEAGIAQQLKMNDKMIDCAVRGGTVFNAIPKQPKPGGMSDEDFAARVKDEQGTARQSYQYLEAAGINAISGEVDPKKRMSYIERYLAAFPDSQYQEQVMQLAVYSLGQLNDPQKLATFGEKALASNPNSISMLVLLANALVDSTDPAYIARAATYASNALELSKGPSSGGDVAKQRLYVGLAHSALGYALLKQEKTVPAISELKAGAELLKDNADAYSAVLFRLGFAYAKANKLAEAKEVLTECIAVKGPYQSAARDLLGKVQAGPRAHK